MFNSTFTSSGMDIYSACRNSVGSKTTNTMFSIFSTFFLLPLFLLILSMGFQRWRRQRSAGVKMSHTDFFTYNMMIMEFLSVLASVTYTFSIYIKSETMFLFGMSLFNLSLPGQTFFHALTCAERHLAVVHPITYMRLRESFGVRIRNLSSVSVWLLSFGWTGLTVLYLPGFPTAPFFSILSVSVFVVCFCCLSVLNILTRSGPGKADNQKEQVDHSKQKAFNMIVAITGALLLRFVGLVMAVSLSQVIFMDLEDMCAFMDSGLWFTFPSSLVLPLLYLHRAGKLSCFKKKTGPKDGAE